MKAEFAYSNAIQKLNSSVIIPDGLEELMDTYLKNLMGDIKDFKAAIDSNDIGKMKKISHKIHGTAQSYGFEAVDCSLDAIQILFNENEKEKIQDLYMKTLKYIENFRNTKK